MPSTTAPSLALGACIIYICLLVAPQAVLAYHNGGTDTNCWRDGYAEFVDPCPVVDIHLEVVGHDFTVNAPFHVRANFSWKASTTQTAILDRETSALVPHANFHMCRVELGWCTPNVNVQPNLVTQTQSNAMNATLFEVPNMIVQAPGDWMIVAHITVHMQPNTSQAEDPVLVRWDAAAGTRVSFKPAYSQWTVSEWAIVFINTMAWLGLVGSCATCVMVLLWKDHWVLKASSANLSAAIAFGCVLTFCAVFVMLPPPAQTAVSTATPQCVARVWMLSLAFDCVVIPLALKTWRVAVLFDCSAAASFRKRAIRDADLFKLAAMLIAVDMVFCLLWTSLFPLALWQIPSSTSPTEFYMLECTGTNQFAFEIVTMVVHGIPLIWLAMVGRRVRFHFRQRSIMMATSPSTSSAPPGAIRTQTHPDRVAAQNEFKLNQFNESEALALALASISFVSVFAISLQYTLRDSPTARMVMISGAIAWSGYFILGVLFLPKAYDVWVLERDGITKRKTQSLRGRIVSSTKRSTTTSTTSAVGVVPPATKPPKSSDDLALL